MKTRPIAVRNLCSSSKNAARQFISRKADPLNRISQFWIKQIQTKGNCSQLTSRYFAILRHRYPALHHSLQYSLRMEKEGSSKPPF